MIMQRSGAGENVDFAGWEGSVEGSSGRNNRATQRHPEEIFYKNIGFVGNGGRKVGEAENVRCNPYGITLRYMCIRVWKSVHMCFWLYVKVFMHSRFYTHCLHARVCVCTHLWSC